MRSAAVVSRRAAFGESAWAALRSATFVTRSAAFSESAGTAAAGSAAVFGRCAVLSEATRAAAIGQTSARGVFDRHTGPRPVGRTTRVRGRVFGPRPSAGLGAAGQVVRSTAVPRSVPGSVPESASDVTGVRARAVRETTRTVGRWRAGVRAPAGVLAGTRGVRARPDALGRAFGPAARCVPTAGCVRGQAFGMPTRTTAVRQAAGCVRGEVFGTPSRAAAVREPSTRRGAGDVGALAGVRESPRSRGRVLRACGPSVGRDSPARLARHVRARGGRGASGVHVVRSARVTVRRAVRRSWAAASSAVFRTARGVTGDIGPAAGVLRDRPGRPVAGALAGRGEEVVRRRRRGGTAAGGRCAVRRPRSRAGVLRRGWRVVRWWSGPLRRLGGGTAAGALRGALPVRGRRGSAGRLRLGRGTPAGVRRAGRHRTWDIRAAVLLQQVGHAQPTGVQGPPASSGRRVFLGGLVTSGSGAATAGLVGHPVSLQLRSIVGRHHELTTARTHWLHQRRVTCLGDTTDDRQS